MDDYSCSCVDGFEGTNCHCPEGEDELTSDQVQRRFLRHMIIKSDLNAKYFLVPKLERVDILDAAANHHA